MCQLKDSQTSSKPRCTEKKHTLKNMSTGSQTTQKLQTWNSEKINSQRTSPLWQNQIFARKNSASQRCLYSKWLPKEACCENIQSALENRTPKRNEENCRRG